MKIACACGCEYTPDEWLQLKLIGCQETFSNTNPILELRQCKCESTIGRYMNSALQYTDGLGW